jgi:hypothetical protein
VLISTTSPFSLFPRPSRSLLLPALRPIPSYGSREILLVTGSLSTVDGAGDLVRTIGELRADRVRCSVVSLAAEVHAFRLLAHATGGAFGVALDRPHLARLLAAHIAPLPVDKTQTHAQAAGGGARIGTGVGAPIKAPPPRVWIQMGFPLVTTDALSYCTWSANSLAFYRLAFFVCMRVFCFTFDSACIHTHPQSLGGADFDRLHLSALQLKVLRAAHRLQNMRLHSRVGASAGAFLPPPVSSARLPRGRIRKQVRMHQFFFYDCPRFRFPGL